MFKKYKPVYKKIRKKSKKIKNKRDYPTNNNIKSSKLEVFFREHILETLNVDYQQQKKVSTKYYDFYIPKYNLLIEVDGDYYHAKDRSKKLNEIQKKNIINDHKKNLIAKRKGYRIIRFWESDINEKTLTVIKELKEELKKVGYPNN